MQPTYVIEVNSLQTSNKLVCVIYLANLCLLFVFSFSSPSRMLMLGMLNLSLSQRSLRLACFSFFLFSLTSLYYSIFKFTVFPSSYFSANEPLQLASYFSYYIFHFRNLHLVPFTYCISLLRLSMFFSCFKNISNCLLAHFYDDYFKILIK